MERWNGRACAEYISVNNWKSAIRESGASLFITICNNGLRNFIAAQKSLKIPTIRPSNGKTLRRTTFGCAQNWNIISNFKDSASVIGGTTHSDRIKYNLFWSARRVWRGVDDSLWCKGTQEHVMAWNYTYIVSVAQCLLQSWAVKRVVARTEWRN